jgi:membrane protein
MVLLVLRESLKSFSFNRGLERAATLSYYGFFAMIPMLLILVFLASSIIASSDWALKAIADAAADVSPRFNEVILHQVMLLSRQRAWSLVSLLVLLWSVTPLTGAIRSAFGTIFRADQKLTFVRAKLRDAMAVLMILVLLVLFVTGRAVTTLIASGRFGAWTGTFDVIALAIRLLIATACAGLFYVSLSPIRLRFSLLLAGSLLMTFLLGLIGPVFGLVLRFNPDYGYVFGSMKATFLLFVWVYYCFAAMLFATEVMANIRRRDVLVIKNLFLRAPTRGDAALLYRFCRSWAPGETIFKEGDSGREMCYILEGSVKLSHNGILLREMTASQYFGEMAMLIGSARTATAVAGDAGVTLATVSPENFDVVLRENPEIVLAILREMASRLKATNEQMQKRN